MIGLFFQGGKRLCGRFRVRTCCAGARGGQAAKKGTGAFAHAQGARGGQAAKRQQALSRMRTDAYACTSACARIILSGGIKEFPKYLLLFGKYDRIDKTGQRCAVLFRAGRGAAKACGAEAVKEGSRNEF